MMCTTMSIIIVLNVQASVVSTANRNTTSCSSQRATKSVTFKSHTLQLLIVSIGQGSADHCHRLVKVYSILKFPPSPPLFFWGIMGGVLVIHDVERTAPRIGQLEEASIIWN